MITGILEKVKGQVFCSRFPVASFWGKGNSGKVVKDKIFYLNDFHGFNAKTCLHLCSSAAALAGGHAHLPRYLTFLWPFFSFSQL
jgi:hypothetical protein